ncbi:MAG: shikimate kinase [Gammaproteobacteria bacterium]|nr:shikimate kinase [Gammaproteobacteria bacterium]
MQIIIVGSMGAGKTTIGRSLATKLDMPFYDIDHEIVARCGVDIPTIFDIEGEEGFRSRETQTLEEICQLSDAVIATGGGAVTRPENNTIIQHADHVIYLDVTVNEQLRRTGKDRNRPLLQAENPRAILESLAKVRRPLYESVATATFKTDGMACSKVTRIILDALNLRGTEQKHENG